MDEMRVKLSTKFMRGVVAKLISMAISKKYGCKVDIQLNDLDIRFADGDTSISTNVDIKLNSDEFKKIIKSVGLD